MFDAYTAPTDDTEPADRPAVTTPEDAVAVARDALAADGHGDADVRGDPYRQSASWVVQARDGDAFNVHVDVASGSARVARVREFEDA